MSVPFGPITPEKQLGVIGIPWEGVLGTSLACQPMPCHVHFCFVFNGTCFFVLIFIYLFMAVLGLRFCARAFSSCGKRGPLFIAVRGPLTVAASLVAEHRLQTCRLSSCGSRAYLLCSMWDLPRPGLEPVSPALASRLSTTAPPGKPPYSFLLTFNYISFSSAVRPAS